MEAMTEQYIFVGEEIGLQHLTNEWAGTQDNPLLSCTILPHLTIFIFTIYHSSPVYLWIPGKSI